MSTHANRVKMTTTTTGTGTITLGSASTGYQSFADAYGANATVDILIVDGANWEVARNCLYTHSGTTLNRGTWEDSSNGTGAITLSGSAVVSVIAPASFGNELEKQLSRGVVLVSADGSTTQSIATGAWRKVSTTLATVIEDDYTWWDTTNKKFTPQRAGLYLIQASAVQANGTAATNTAALYKNGSNVVQGPSCYSTAYTGAFVSGLVALNGSSDYVEFYLYPGAVTADLDPAAGSVTFAAIYLGA